MKEFEYKSKYATYGRCIFNVGRYENGNLAVEVWSQTEGPITRITVNPDKKISDEYLAIKDYSENEGTVDTLVDMGMIEEEPVQLIFSGHVVIPVHKLTKTGKEMLGI